MDEDEAGHQVSRNPHHVGVAGLAPRGTRRGSFIEGIAPFIRQRRTYGTDLPKALDGPRTRGIPKWAPAGAEDAGLPGRTASTPRGAFGRATMQDGIVRAALAPRVVGPGIAPTELVGCRPPRGEFFKQLRRSVRGRPRTGQDGYWPCKVITACSWP
jgi:hypothetical protein